MVKKLRSVGFEFKQFEHMCGPCMTYYYNDETYTIGGAWDGKPRSKLEQKIAREGVWLPKEEDLMRWLELTDHSVVIKYVDRYYYGKAIDISGNVVEGSGPDLLCCMYKMIYKICRNSKGTITPADILILDLEE